MRNGEAGGGERWNQPQHAADAEASKADPAGPVDLTQQDRGDEEAGECEEDVDTDIAVVRKAQLGVEE